MQQYRNKKCSDRLDSCVTGSSPCDQQSGMTCQILIETMCTIPCLVQYFLLSNRHYIRKSEMMASIHCKNSQHLDLSQISSINW